MGRIGTTTTALALIALAVACASAFAGLGKNPANHRSLVNKPIEDYRYDGADNCTKRIPKGTRALAKWLGRHTSGELWGITRCEKLSSDSHSLHSESRAIDWHMDARKAKQKKQAMRLIRDRLLATDSNGNQTALARRMGVQGIIFDCKSWWSNPGGLEKYSYCYKGNGKRRKNLDPTAAHIDHIHIELNQPGSRKRTSFWRSPLSRR